MQLKIEKGYAKIVANGYIEDKEHKIKVKLKIIKWIIKKSHCEEILAAHGGTPCLSEPALCLFLIQKDGFSLSKKRG